MRAKILVDFLGFHGDCAGNIVPIFEVVSGSFILLLYIAKEMIGDFLIVVGE